MMSGLEKNDMIPEYIRNKKWKNDIQGNNTIMDDEEYIDTIYSELLLRAMKEDNTDSYWGKAAWGISGNINRLAKWRRESISWTINEDLEEEEADQEYEDKLAGLLWEEPEEEDKAALTEVKEALQ